MRAQMGATPLETVKLSDNLTMLSGPGGNVVVLNGPDGKVVVDSFVQTAWAKLKQSLDGMGNGPIRWLIDTHWHFDHTDNNSNFRAAGAQILAHENTKKRLSETHDLLGMHFAPSPASALPTQTFTATHRLQVQRRKSDCWATFRPRIPIPTSTFSTRAPMCSTWATLSSTACIRSSTPAPAAISTA